MISFPLSLQEIGEFFLSCSSWKLGDSTRWIQERVEGPKDWTLKSSHCKASLHSNSSNVPELSFKCSYQFLAPVAPNPDKQMSPMILCVWLGSSVFTSFPLSGWQFAPVAPISLTYLRKVVDFQLVQFSHGVKMGASKFFTCCTWGKKFIHLNDQLLICFSCLLYYNWA